MWYRPSALTGWTECSPVLPGAHPAVLWALDAFLKSPMAVIALRCCYLFIGLPLQQTLSSWPGLAHFCTLSTLASCWSLVPWSCSMCVWLKDSLDKLEEIHLPEISFWYWIYLQKRLHEHPVTSMDFPLDLNSLSEPPFATKGKDQLNSQLIEVFVSWREQPAFVCSSPSCLMLRKEACTN